MTLERAWAIHPVAWFGVMQYDVIRSDTRL